VSSGTHRSGAVTTVEEEFVKVVEPVPLTATDMVVTFPLVV
jgi:hypothetical protein